MCELLLVSHITLCSLFHESDLIPLFCYSLIGDTVEKLAFGTGDIWRG